MTDQDDAGAANERTLGYEAFAQMEARFAAHALQEHRLQVDAWCQLLTLLAKAFSGGFHLVAAGEDGQVMLLRLQLLGGLGAGTSKLALDAALSGYYSQCFMLTRHMLETWGQAAYVRVRPNEAYRWYTQPGDPKHWMPIPTFDKIRPVIRRHTEPRELVDRVASIIKLLNKGAHPSGEALAQTVGSRPGHYVVGPNYDHELAASAFHFGIYANMLLLGELAENVAEREAWLEQVRVAIHDNQTWLSAWFAKQDI